MDRLGDLWAPIKLYWKTRSGADREAIRGALSSYEATKGQYVGGSPNPELTAPETWTFLLSPKFQEWFRSREALTLVAWGKNDPVFIPPEAEAYKRLATRRSAFARCWSLHGQDARRKNLRTDLEVFEEQSVRPCY
jgi:hypothetical protein